MGGMLLEEGRKENDSTGSPTWFSVHTLVFAGKEWHAQHRRLNHKPILKSRPLIDPLHCTLMDKPPRPSWVPSSTASWQTSPPHFHLSASQLWMQA
eukprot:1158747-Pelagomonas_calceolata.AAC.13